MSPKIIQSVSDAIDSIHHFDSIRGHHIFRGQVSCDWRLLPSLFRKYPKSHYPARYASLFEVSLCGPLILGMKGPYLNTYDPIEHLMVLQHFNIPTRLLDWSSDILVALFFACYDVEKKNNEKNGRLFILGRDAYPTYKFNCSETEVLKNRISDKNIDFFQDRIKNPEVSVIEPHVKNPRMRVQDGCFLFFPFGNLPKHDSEYFDLIEFNRAKNQHIKSENIKNKTKNPQTFLAHKDVDWRFKKHILEELEMMHGISGKTLFVELEYIESAKRYYENIGLSAELKAKELLLKVQAT